MKRAAVGLGALTLAVGALTGVGFSGATWTHDSGSDVDVQAAYDWTEPKVTMTPLAAGSFDTITLEATATDRSDLASLHFEYRPMGGSAWTSLTGCSPLSGPSPLTYSCLWGTDELDDGDYEFRAVATDTATPTAYSAASNVVTTQVVNDGGLVLWPVKQAVSGQVDLTAEFIGETIPTAKILIEYQTGGTWTQLAGCYVQHEMVLGCSWDTTGFANGRYHLRASLDAGNSLYTDAQFVTVDNAAPTITSLQVPSGVLSGTVSISASASDAHSSVVSIRFEHRAEGAATWSECGTDLVAPYSCLLGTTTLPDGPHEFRIMATDVAGNTATSSIETRTVSNAPASVTVTGPAQGTAVSGNVPVTVEAQSSRGVGSVVVQYRSGATGAFSNACVASGGGPYTCTWSTAGLPAGGYQLRAVLTEAAGGVTIDSTPVGVTVVAGVDGVSVTSPAPGARVSGTLDVTAAAGASGGISGVTVQTRPVGGAWTDLCTDQTAPYSCPWNTAGIAWVEYEVQAVMARTVGAPVTSTPVMVRVDNVVGTLSLVRPTTPLLKGVVEIEAEASSNATPQGVELQRRPTTGGAYETLCLVQTAPYLCSYDTTGTSYGAFDVRGVMTLANGQTVTEGPVQVVVDNRVLAGADVNAVNGGTAGRVDTGDSLVLTYTGRVDPASLGLGAGGSTEVTFTGLNGSVPDTATFTGALGTVSFPQDYVTNNSAAVFAATAVVEETTLPGLPGEPVTRVTVTLGALQPGSDGLRSLNTQQNDGNLLWTPASGAADRFGVSSLTGQVVESGASENDL